MSRTPSAAASIEFVLSEGAAQLADVRTKVKRHLETLGVNEQATHAVDLAVEELAGNVFRHGFQPGAGGTLRVEVLTTSSTVRVVLLDDARPFDPSRHPEPGPVGSIAEAPIGGRGIAMVRRVCRALRYRREAGWNRVEVEVARSARAD